MAESKIKLSLNFDGDCVELASFSNTAQKNINLNDDITNYKFLMLNLYTGGQLVNTSIITVQDFINISAIKSMTASQAGGSYRYWQAIAIYNTNTSILGQCTTDYSAQTPSAKLFGIK